jgi:HSP20 family protein
MNYTARRPKARVTYQPYFGNLINEFFNTAVGDVYKKTESKQSFTNPAVNVISYDDRTVLQVALPGFSKKEVNITVDQDTLTIEGTQDQADNTENYRLREFNYAGFKKSFRLPEDIDTDKIRANFKSGILKLELYKKEEAIPQPARSIEIA